MTSVPEVHLEADADALATFVARKTVAALALALDARDEAHLVVTGGSILEATMAALVPASDGLAVDWSRVHVWWGDERFVASDSSDRNELPARAKAFDRLPLDPAKIHPMPPSDGRYGDDLDAAAAGYAAELATAALGTDTSDSTVDVPRFDVVLLGLGPDGHCASLFPDHEPGVQVRDRAVIAVRESPKPPPERLSLTIPALDSAEEIWFVASGDGKADAVGRALGGADPVHVPSAGPRGRTRTLWLLDRDAAVHVPDSVPRADA
ncbi:6-phosphogluconolactonase [Jatrophihabitans endophyticus]|uniref:6-phosphogluconolactonase n=1 Tax=Jatrophihabitans endophyticus TaxID=1206085 RepID=UPI0019ED55AB|nr:6-phosphogluconolactonase [Jatrophihabitans endophyticus]MBE7186946.1 6-phosphogluconolactonase [Jatrophihabitans endophyticus]